MVNGQVLLNQQICLEPCRPCHSHLRTQSFDFAWRISRPGSVAPSWSPTDRFQQSLRIWLPLSYNFLHIYIYYIYSGCNLHSFQELQLWDIKSPKKTNMLTFPSKNIYQSYYLLLLELGRKHRWNICGSETFPKYIIYKCHMSKYTIYIDIAMYSYIS